MENITYRLASHTANILPAARIILPVGLASGTTIRIPQSTPTAAPEKMAVLFAGGRVITLQNPRTLEMATYRRI